MMREREKERGKRNSKACCFIQCERGRGGEVLASRRLAMEW